MKRPDRAILSRLKSFFKANPGAAFIIAFQALLISAAILLALGNSNAANETAVYAFYALVVGIAVQIGIVVREERKRARAGSTGSGSAPT